MRIITTYDEVSITSEKSGKCPVCGKNAVRRKKFFQTLNPFNKNKDGSIKSRYDIKEELKAQALVWKQEPVFHAKCER